MNLVAAYKKKTNYFKFSTTCEIKFFLGTLSFFTCEVNNFKVYLITEPTNSRI